MATVRRLINKFSFRRSARIGGFRKLIPEQRHFVLSHVWRALREVGLEGNLLVHIREG